MFLSFIVQIFMVGYLLGMKGVAEELMIHGDWWKYAIGNWISTIQYNNMMTEERRNGEGSAVGNVSQRN